MHTVLVVDDEAHIREVVCFALGRASIQTIEAADGDSAIEIFGNHQIDLVVLDIVMPGRDGTDVCRELRRTSDVPIVFLTSMDEEVDRIVGFELGGDDYITKPFSPRELVARIKAVLRRGRTLAQTTPGETPLVHGQITMDLSRHVVHSAGVEVRLTATEFAMLRTLMQHPGNVYTRSQLMEHAYELQRVVSDRTIDSHIRRLRGKLKLTGADVIETVHGVGFRLRPARP